MLRSIEKLEKFNVEAKDGVIGHVQDFLFDDESWVIRYVVVNTGAWLSGRKVLISPISIGRVDTTKKHLQVLLNREQIENSPDIDSDMAVSRRHELRYFKYYGYPCYWGGASLWGDGSFPSLMCSDIDSRANGGDAEVEPQQRPDHGGLGESGRLQSGGDESSLAAVGDTASAQHADAHLCSCKSVLHYEIQATDGLLRHVEGFLVDEKTWAIRYLIAETSHWWLGHQVLISPDWITDVSWLDGTVGVDRSRADIRALAPFESVQQLNQELVVGLHRHDDRSAHQSSQARG